MKQYAFLTALLCLIMIFTPLICVTVKNHSNTDAIQLQQESNTVSITTLSGKAVEADIDTYLIGTLAAEMPASYESEALKAQAVAAYTYYRWLKENSDNSDFSISADSSVHQGYLTEEEMKEKWGSKYESYYNKIKAAVMSVLGECIMYEGEPIMAVYHAISSGRTLSAEAVWGEAVPYLQSVTAVGDKLSPDFEAETKYTQQEMIKLLKTESTKENLIEKIDTDEYGYVTKLSAGGKSFTGYEFSSLIGLRSPVFTAEYKQGRYIFSVSGYGHGVGMSQYSADYMARQGSTYQEILAHFYKGTYIDKIL